MPFISLSHTQSTTICIPIHVLITTLIVGMVKVISKDVIDTCNSSHNTISFTIDQDDRRLIIHSNSITKLPESGDLCSNITEFGVLEGDPPPPQTKWYCHTDLQKNIILFLYLTV